MPCPTNFSRQQSAWENEQKVEVLVLWQFKHRVHYMQHCSRRDELLLKFYYNGKPEKNKENDWLDFGSDFFVQL